MIPFTSHVDGYYDVSDQMIDDLRRRAEAHFRRRQAEFESIASVAEFERHREKVRQAFMTAIGGLPEVREPLEAQCAGTIDRGSYVIEKIVYQSLPEFYVTSSLYVPKGLDGPVPGILLVCGHSELGKAEPRYQAVCVDLAENGFVVLAMDPPGQGERFQYFDPDTGRRIIGGCTTEHSHAGLQYTLAGASIARHFIWDGIRGIDYLASRFEVDPERIGVTGNSGGGTQTCLLLMSEPRIAAAVPCCFVMTLESYMKTGQAQDAEQLVRGAFATGPDHHEFITAIAPKPVLVGAALYDFFPIEGAREAVRRAKKVYGLYGVEENVDIAYSPHTHGYAAELREACVNWMRQHLQGRAPDFRTGEPDILPAEELNCTSEGQVLAAYRGCKTVFDLNLARLERNGRPKPEGGPEERRRVVAETLGLDLAGLEYPINPRIVREEVFEGYPVEHVFFFSAPNIVVTGVMIHPRQAGPPTQTDLVLLPNGTSDMERERIRLESLLRRGHRLFVFDARGLGAVQTRAVNSRGMWQFYATEYKLASDAMMLGISTLGLRVFDVLRGLAYLRTREDCKEGRLGIYGYRFGALLAYLAAALDGRLDSITVEDMLYSYWDLARTRYYDAQSHGPWSLAWGTLQRFDLADLLPCMGSATCAFINPRDARGEVIGSEMFEREFLALAESASSGALPEVRLAASISDC